MKFDFTRRELMHTALLRSGATLLGSILAQRATRGAALAAAPRRKFVFIVQSNGLHVPHVVPAGVEHQDDGRSIPKNDRLVQHDLRKLTLPDPIAGFEPFKDRMTILLGLSGRIAEGGTGGHSTNHGCLGCYPGNKGPMASTIDAALAAASPGVVKQVGLGILDKAEQTMNYQISAIAPGKTAPIQCSSESAYRGLFGSVADGASRMAFDRRTQLLDFMADDVRRSRDALVGEERDKLDNYLDAYTTLRDRQAEIDGLEASLRRHRPQLDDKFAKPTETNRLEAQFALGTAALVSGLTNVVTIASGGGGQNYISFPELGVPIGGHEYGHGRGINGLTAAECFVKVRQYHVGLIADMARRLNEVPEGDGTMLDNTVIVYLSDSGESHHPRLYDWPVIVLGDLGGKLNTRGRLLQLPGYGNAGHRTMANFYLSLLHAAGDRRTSFGIADPGLKDLDQRGPLEEILS